MVSLINENVPWPLSQNNINQNDYGEIDLLGVCVLRWPYMDITLAIFHVFLRYKKMNNIKSIEIIKIRDPII